MNNLQWLPDHDFTEHQAAHEYASHGRRVLPLHSIRGGACTCRRAGCPSPGKHPLADHGVADATTDGALIRAWWTRWPWANLGLAMGDGWAAVDVDGKEHREALERKHGAWPFTTRQLSGREGGEHWIYQVPPGFKSKGKLAPHVDLKHEGGYIVAAPSIHISGRHYRWLVAIDPVPMPEWMIEILKVPAVQHKPYVPPAVAKTKHDDGCYCEPCRRIRYARASLAGIAKKIAGAGQGERNNLLNWGWWNILKFRDVIPESEAKVELKRAAESCGLSEREIDQVLR